MTQKNDETQVPSADTLPTAVVAPRWHTAPWLVWAVPVLAALIGGWILVQSAMNHGPTITITFKNAEGLEAGKTKIKFKEVDIGDVKKIAVSKDRTQVIVTAQLTKGSDGFLRDDTRFWVVRPRIGAGGVSGLSTLFSGAYIGVDVGKSEDERDEFVGLDVAPPVLTDLAGRRFELKTDHLGSLDIGAPIYFRHIQVGQIVGYDLDKGGTGVTVHLFVNAPYDQYVTPATRFWNASGVELTVDANGLKVHTESIASMLGGGITFQTPADAATVEPAKEKEVFTLYPDRDIAMKHADTQIRKMLMYFKESVRDLTIGAPVDFRGIVIGEVRSIGLEYDKKDKIFRFPVEVNIYPERLRERYREGATMAETKDGDDHEVLDQLVKSGLRAQLQTGNLITGKLFVALDFHPDAPKYTIDWSKSPIALATVPGTIDELQSSLTKIMRKLDKVPVEDIGKELNRVLVTLNSTLQSTDKLIKHLDGDVAPEAKEALSEARKALASANRNLSEDSSLQQDLHTTLQDIDRAAQALHTLTDYLERHPESLLRGKPEDKH